MTTPSPVGGNETKRSLTLEAQQRITDAYQAGVSIRGIASTFGHAKTTVRAVLKKSGVQLRDDACKPKMSRDELIRRHAEGWSTRKIADACGAEVTTIHKRLAALGLDVSPTLPELPLQKLAAAHAGGQSMASLARQYGVSRETIARRLASTGHAPARGEPVISPLLLADLCRRGLTPTEISAATGVYVKTIRKHLAASGLRAADKRPGRQRPAFIPENQGRSNG